MRTLTNGVASPRAIVVALTGTGQSLDARIPYLNFPLQSGLGESGRESDVLVVFVAPADRNWVKDRGDDGRQTGKLAALIADLRAKHRNVPLCLSGLSDGGTKTLEMAHRRPELLDCIVVHSGMMQSAATLAIPAPATRSLFIVTPGDHTPAEKNTRAEFERHKSLGWDCRLLEQTAKPEQKLAERLMHWWSPSVNGDVLRFVLEEPDFVWG